MPAFRYALELGAGALEMDAHITADGKIVISHDPDGARLAGVRAAIRDTQCSDVQRWDLGKNFLGPGGERFSGRGYRIPTLEEVLVELPNVPINIDIKQHKPSMVEPLLSLLRRLRVEERVLLASFDSRTLGEVRRAHYAGPTALGQRELMGLLLLPGAVLSLMPHRGDAAQIPTHAGRIPLGTRRVIDKCHELGLRVDYWTVNDPDEARRLLDLGADGIMTDDVRRIAPVFRERAGR